MGMKEKSLLKMNISPNTKMNVKAFIYKLNEFKMYFSSKDQTKDEYGANCFCTPPLLFITLIYFYNEVTHYQPGCTQAP